MMKQYISPNEPAFPVENTDTNSYNGLPVRLELASRFLAADLGNSSRNWTEPTNEVIANALDYADRLIEEYNK